MPDSQRLAHHGSHVGEHGADAFRDECLRNRAPDAIHRAGHARRFLRGIERLVQNAHVVSSNDERGGQYWQCPKERCLLNRSPTTIQPESTSVANK